MFKIKKQEITTIGIDEILFLEPFLGAVLVTIVLVPLHLVISLT